MRGVGGWEDEASFSLWGWGIKTQILRGKKKQKKAELMLTEFASLPLFHAAAEFVL